MSNSDNDKIDWSLTTWEGARREQLRRWAQLPLENVVAALEEMQEIVEWLHPSEPGAKALRSDWGERSKSEQLDKQ